MSSSARIFPRALQLWWNFTGVKPCIGIRPTKFHTFPALHAGHSKWANIKHTKALKDGQKAASFLKYSRQIQLAIQDGGSPNPTVNSLLKAAIDQALRKSMPMATIQNVIKRCEQSKTQVKKHIVGIRALNKIYMICIVYTDNLALLKMNIAATIKKVRGAFVDEPHLFEEYGIIEAKPDTAALERIKSEAELEEICTEAAIEYGAEEVEVADYENGLVNFICRPENINNISTRLNEKGYRVEGAEHIFVPNMPITLPESELKLYDNMCGKLRALEGIEEIYDNLAPPEG